MTHIHWLTAGIGFLLGVFFGPWVMTQVAKFTGR